jgi:hypothetical protein
MAAEDIDNRSKVYPTLFSVNQWKELLGGTSAWIDKPGLFPRMAPLYQTPSDESLRMAAAAAVGRLPAWMEASGREPLTSEELRAATLFARSYLRTLFTAPTFDGPLILRNANVLGWKETVLNNADFTFTVKGAPALLFFDTKDGLSVPISDNRDDHAKKSTIAKIAFVADIVIEVIGVLAGLIGVSIPVAAKEEEEAIKEIVKKLLLKDGFDKKFEAFMAALKRIKELVFGSDEWKVAWKEIFSFFEFLEGGGDLGEIVSHLLAGLSAWDYALSGLKFLCWLAALFLSDGLALVAELVGLGLSIAGIIVKGKDAGEIFN